MEDNYMSTTVDRKEKRSRIFSITSMIIIGVIFSLLLITAILSTFEKDTVVHNYDASIPANEYSYRLTEKINKKQGDRLGYSLTIQEGYLNNISAFYIPLICYGFWLGPNYSHLPLHTYIKWVQFDNYDKNFTLYKRWEIGVIKDQSHSEGNQVYFSERSVNVNESSQYYLLLLNDGNTTAKLSFEYKISNIYLDFFDNTNKIFTAALALFSTFFVVYFYFFQVAEKREKKLKEEKEKQEEAQNRQDEDERRRESQMILYM
jgi:hypothetical protein